MDDNVIAQLFDIQEPLINLRNTLERRTGVDLSDHSFWLQDSQRLKEDSTLVDQCVQGEGLVQINLEINDKKINIVDVLKPADDAGAEDELGLGGTGPVVDPELEGESSSQMLDEEEENEEEKSGDKGVTKWVVCATFRKEQLRLDIPMDPEKWSSSHVSHWIKWAIKEFPKTSISLGDWNLNGKQLCSMKNEEFKKKVPIDPSDLLWTHLELLRKCKFVAVVQKKEKKDKSVSYSVC